MKLHFKRIFGNLKGARDKNLIWVERCFMGLSTALIIGGFSLVLTGVGFVSDPMWDSNVWGFENMEM